ncbi:MAG: DinB family protein [Vicinamibacterales bacterium]
MSSQTAVLSAATDGETAAPAFVLSILLDDLASVLRTVPSEIYRARFANAVTGSIGEHVRHCLDHVSALVTANASVPLSYDARHRGTCVETEPAAAVEHIATLRSELATWPTSTLDEPLSLLSQITADGQMVTSRSTVARELVFVMNHTIHHQAIIGVLLATHGHPVPGRFGHAPSTPTRH